jgi:hypothetical protein
MAMYEGKQPCAGCGRTGTENPRRSKDGLCSDCAEALKIGQMMVNERDMKRSYYRLDEFMNTTMTWYTIPIREIDSSLRALLRSFSQFDSNHAKGSAGASNPICGRLEAITARDTFVLPVAVYDKAKTLCEVILEAAKTLYEEKKNYRKELDAELAAQKNEIYNDGIAHGRNLLNQLNCGEITAKDIETFVKKY